MKSISLPGITSRHPLATLALATALVASIQPASAASVVDFPNALQYEAEIDEVNDVEIRPRRLLRDIVLDIRDSAGISGCARLPNINTIRCDANQLNAVFMEMNDKDDILTVNESDLRLTGYQLSVFAGIGDDSLTGGSEDDEFLGGTGDDLLVGGGGADFLYGEIGDDRLLGGDDTDKLDGGAGKDIMYGEAGDDVLDGGSFDDQLNGGTGDDTLRGGTGDDFINAVDGDRDTVDCGLGRDRVRADQFDTVSGNCEDITRITL